MPVLGGVVCMAGLTRGRSFPGLRSGRLRMAARRSAWHAVARSHPAQHHRGGQRPRSRTAIWSLLGLIVFGLLFASADALFAEWADAVVPDVRMDRFVARFFVTVAVGGVVLAGGLPRPEPARGPAGRRSRRPVQSRYEWLAPVALIDLVFLVFLVAQATVFFGGHDYLRRTTGLTYAEYVHQGFGQLIVATALTLLVVWAASHKASVETDADRLWLRGALGLLCVLALVVVASALYRMQLYQEAYGFSQLRLLVDVFEIWLGLIVVGVIVAGIRLRGAWLPRMALVSAVMLLGLAAINPDAWIARHNLDRYEQTGKIDWAYLRRHVGRCGPRPSWTYRRMIRGCALAGRETKHDDPVEWNLGRSRARAALEGVDTAPVSTQACD